MHSGDPTRRAKRRQELVDDRHEDFEPLSASWYGTFQRPESYADELG